MDFDPSARARLVDRVESLGGMDSDEHANPTVTFEEFFTGNRDTGSIGCNLIEHPGVETFCRVLKSVEGRPDVSGVHVMIAEVDDEDAWPFSDTVFIATSAPASEVEGWVEELSPDEVDEIGDVSRLHPATPRPPEGQRMYMVWWD